MNTSRSKDLSVKWNGLLIGHARNMKVDNYFVYGDWLPINGKTLQLFIDSLRISEEESVSVGGFNLSVATEPDSQFEGRLFLKD